MLQKHPKPTYRKVLKRGAAILFLVEAALFAGSYAAWYRLNTSRGYYKIGESLSSDKTPRDRDLTIWKQEGKI